MNVLIINSYAGSLTLAAHQAGAHILASMEDHGYALGTQKLNFPNLSYVDNLPWPRYRHDALRGSVVIAHPPCAAFSAQNNSANKGVSSSHFACTKRVIDYAGEHGADCVAIESVTGAYDGAKEFYAEYPQRYGYDVYKILQNAVTFGVPQWRPRYWTVMFRRGLLYQDLFILRHLRKIVILDEALGRGYVGDKNPYTEKYWERQVEGLKRGGMTDAEINRLVTDSVGHLGRNLAALYELDLAEAKRRFDISSFDSHVFTMLNPAGFAHTVMCVSNWLWRGRPVNVPELNVIAGFPWNYKFDKLREQKCYLSKGVAPPVAKWLLKEIESNLLQKAEPFCPGGYVQMIRPGETADFRLKKSEVMQRDFFEKVVDNEM